MSKIIKKLVLSAITIFALLSTSAVFAAPYSGEAYNLKQPDGSFVSVKVFGDEFYQRVESPDGYTLIRDPETNWICYANLNQNSTEFISSGIIYQDATSEAKEKTSDAERKPFKDISKLPKSLKLSKQSILSKVSKAQKDMKWDKFLSESSSAAQNKLFNSSGNSANNNSRLFSPTEAATTNNVIGLTILIDFPDNKANISKDEVSAMINQTNYKGYSNNGSVKDYFEYFSSGKLIYTNNVTEYYTAEHNKSYYDNPTDGKAKELIVEALTYLKNNNYNFSSLTLDENNSVMALNVLYAGKPESGWSKGLWPHKSSISTFDANGVNFSRYQISNIGEELNIGTFIHENGHSLCGWPDTYDYGGDSSGAGGFDVMCSNDKKIQYLQIRTLEAYFLVGVTQSI